MMIVGVDVHKQSHTFVACNAAGKKIAQKTTPARTLGHFAAMTWAE